jgi:hypothetical protein
MAAPQAPAPAAPAALAATPAEPAEARTLAPFAAAYAVEKDGKPMGEASLRLVHADGAQWRVDLGIHATRGLLGLAGLDAQQSTLFRADGQQRYLPLSQSTVRQALFFDRKSVGTFDWNAQAARWRGDVSGHRQQPVALREGDMSSLLVNLAVIRDARPGASLQYRVVDNGRARAHRYAVSPEKEGITVGGIDYLALRVSRVDDADEDTVFWVAEGVPTPIRILKREDGKDVYDLHLIQYQGA